jgi:hypothetical protein
MHTSIYSLISDTSSHEVHPSLYLSINQSI